MGGNEDLEESASLSRRMLNRAHQNGQEWLARNLQDKLVEAEHHAKSIKHLLMKAKTPVAVDTVLDQTNTVDEAGIASTEESA